jgi:uncharacterized protein involved in tellurium resistance
MNRKTHLFLALCRKLDILLDKEIEFFFKERPFLENSKQKPEIIPLSELDLAKLKEIQEEKRAVLKSLDNIFSVIQKTPNILQQQINNYTSLLEGKNVS